MPRIPSLQLVQIHPVPDVARIHTSCEVVMVTGLGGDVDLDEELQPHMPHGRQEVVQAVSLEQLYGLIDVQMVFEYVVYQ